MVRSALHRIRRWIDRIGAIAIIGFGAKLALDR
jgi:threonine/homoserine/homoserine lactone efflux protein